MFVVNARAAMLSVASESPCPFLVRSFFLYCIVDSTAHCCLVECRNADAFDLLRVNSGAAGLDIGLSWDLRRSVAQGCFNVSGVCMA